MGYRGNATSIQQRRLLMHSPVQEALTWCQIRQHTIFCLFYHFSVQVVYVCNILCSQKIAWTATGRRDAWGEGLALHV